MIGDSTGADEQPTEWRPFRAKDSGAILGRSTVWSGLSESSLVSARSDVRDCTDFGPRLLPKHLRSELLIFAVKLQFRVVYKLRAVVYKLRERFINLNKQGL